MALERRNDSEEATPPRSASHLKTRTFTRLQPARQRRLRKPTKLPKILSSTQDDSVRLSNAFGSPSRSAASPTYQYQEVNPYKREAHFLAINPKGLVPAVEYQGRALYESLVLCEFLEDAFPRPAHAPHLLPADPIDRGYARIWTDYAAKVVVPAHSRLIQAQGPARQRELLEEYYAALWTFAAQIKGPFFLGEQFSLVDAAVAPWVVRDWVVVEHRGFSRAAVGNGWKEYVDRLERRESVVKTSSERQHLQEIYGRYLRDGAQSEQAKGIRAGKTF